MNRSFVWSAALILSPLVSGPALGDDGGLSCAHCKALAGTPGYDEQTGADMANYPPDPQVDSVHLRLELMIPDMNVPEIDGLATLTIEPISDRLGELRLNARGLEIASVKAPGFTTGFTHDGTTLTITFDPPVPAGRRSDVAVSYRAVDPADGLIWTPESPARPGVAAQLHSQGQPQTNSFWFPCHDFPNERLTTELIVTLPMGFTVSSNGRLVSRSNRVVRVDHADGTYALEPFEVFHWLQDKPHPAYLVSLVIGEFDVVDLGTESLPMPVYVPPGRGRDVRATYGDTPAMIDLFERVLDEPYPWDRYAQLVVHNFGAGGMENTSATTMHDTAIIAADELDDHEMDGLIAHELAHQWFGDLLTCRSWEHIWLNEGFATFMADLWTEHSLGREAYDESMLGHFRGLIERDTAEAPESVAMVSKIYDEPWFVFGKPANPYSKGASVLHLLRQRLGDDVFFRGLGDYIDANKAYGLVETDQLRKALEHASGDSLEQFFDQWCRRPGVPHLDVGAAWNDADKTLTISVAQTQNIDGDNPAFEFDLPVWVTSSGDTSAGVWITIPVRGRAAGTTVPLTSEPDIIAVDPRLQVLAALNVTLSEGQWLAQLSPGLPIAARLRAAQVLGESGSDAAAEALARLAIDDGAYRGLRVGAVAALQELGATAHVLAMARGVVPEPAVRARVCTALGALCADDDATRDEALSLLKSRAESDSATSVRAAAVRALGAFPADSAQGTALNAATLNSQFNEIQRAAIDALKQFDSLDALVAVMELTQEQHVHRLRAQAIGAVGTLAGHDMDGSVGLLSALAFDRVASVRRAAGEALSTLDDPRAITTLGEVAARARTPEQARLAERWIDAWRKNYDAGSAAAR